MTRVPVAVLASGEGTNFDALVEEERSGKLPAEIRVLVSNRPAASVLDRAKRQGVPSVVLEPDRKIKDDQERRAEHERRILSALKAYQPRFLVLAGYDRILGPTLLEAFRSSKGYARIVNIHPSLLPDFPGMHAYEQAYRLGAKTAGVTVHLVDDQLDHGPICEQEAFSIEDCASEAAVVARGKKIEHRLYANVLKWVLTEQFRLENQDGRVFVRPS